MGRIDVALDTSGKKGLVKKRISVSSNDDTNPEVVLYLTTDVIHHGGSGRSIFDPDCVSCHVEAGRGKLGQELFDAICAYCHGDSGEEKSASTLTQMAMKETSHIEMAITEGIPGSAMPGYGSDHGGPLNKKEIGSLVDYIKSFGK